MLRDFARFGGHCALLNLVPNYETMPVQARAILRKYISLSSRQCFSWWPYILRWNNIGGHNNYHCALLNLVPNYETMPVQARAILRKYISLSSRQCFSWWPYILRWNNIGGHNNYHINAKNILFISSVKHIDWYLLLLKCPFSLQPRVLLTLYLYNWLYNCCTIWTTECKNISFGLKPSMDTNAKIKGSVPTVADIDS